VIAVAIAYYSCYHNCYLCLRLLLIHYWFSYG
jgi:hypothetical protein